jgi:hypothetical protein
MRAAGAIGGSSMRTIVQHEQLSGSYARSDHVEMLEAGSRRRKRGAAVGGKRYRVLRLRCNNDEDSRYVTGERPRSPT